MKLGKLVDIYKSLKEAEVSEIEVSERLVIVRIMKAARPFVDEFDNYVNDLREKFKTQNTDTIVQKIQQNKGLTESEVDEFMKFNTPVSTAIAEEREREIEVELPKLSEESVVKLIGENGWKMNMLELFE